MLVKTKFVLYSENIDGEIEYEKINGVYDKLKEPLKIKMIGVYKHSFPCSLYKAMTDLKCLSQILSFNRFYHSIINDKTSLKNGTNFNILSLPIIYIYSLIDTKMLHKIKFL